MPIIDRGPHTVVVTPMVVTQGAMGDKTTPGDPVVVPLVAVQSVSAAELERVRLTDTREVYQVIGRGTWPGGALSLVEVTVGPRLGVFDQQGPARQYGMSPRTQHYDVLISARGSRST